MRMQAPTRREISRTTIARTPASGTVARQEQADARPSSAGRRQLGRRTATVAARAMLAGGTGGQFSAEQLLRLTREVLDERPLRCPDNAALIKIATSAAAYLTRYTVPAGCEWVGLTAGLDLRLDAPAPLLVFRLPDVVFADVLLVGAQRFPTRDALAAAAGIRHLAADVLGVELDGVRCLTPCRPSQDAWVAGSEPTETTDLPDLLTTSPLEVPGVA